MFQSVRSNKTKKDLVSKIKQLQEELREKDRLLSEAHSGKVPEGANLLDHLSDAVILSDIHFVICSWNSAAEEIYGWKTTDVIGQNAGELLKTKFQDPSEQVMQQLFNQGCWKGKIIQYRKDGSPVHILASISLIKDEQGEPVNIISVNRDIPEREQAEDALSFEQFLMYTLMNNLPVQIYFKDCESRFIRINNAQARSLGLSDPGQAIGKTDFDFFTDEHAQPAYEDELIIIRTGQPIRKEEKETRDGHPEKWVSTTKLPLRDKDGKIIGTFGTSVDITELVRAEEALRTSNETLRMKLDEINNLHLLLQEQAIRDPLTGLLNRRYLHETIQHEIARADRNQSPLSILMIDIDHFKKVNDSYGHNCGDDVLAALSRRLIANVRKSDMLYRYGGEEFLILMVNTTLDTARKRAEMIRISIERSDIQINDNKIGLTISIGVATYPLHGTIMETIFKAADNALYRAKTAGRNCVVTACL